MAQYSSRLITIAASALSLALVTRPAHAVNTCGAHVQISYVSGPNFPNPGDVVRVQLTLGSGVIQNGTHLTVTRIRFELDCTNNTTGGIPCTDDGNVIGYNGDA